MMICNPLDRLGKSAIQVSLQELLSLKMFAKQFSLRSLKSKNANSGQKICPLLARGMEFAESRRYLPTDDVRSIDWRVTARTGKAHTKLFSEEKMRQMILVADMRTPMFFATKGVFKSVQAALLMGCVGWHAAENGDKVGGLIFEDTSFFECKPAVGKRGLLPFLQAIAQTSKNEDHKKTAHATSKSDAMDQAVRNLKKLSTPGSLIFMVSDFRHFSKVAKDLLVQISNHCDLCLCFINDPLEADFPKNGNYPVTDGNKNLQLAGQSFKSLEKYREQFVIRKNQVANLEVHRRIHFMECTTEDDCLAQLKKFFK